MSAEDYLLGRKTAPTPVVEKATHDAATVRRKIRQYSSEGMGKRAMAKKLGLSERTIFRHLDAIKLQDMETFVTQIEACIEHDPTILTLIEKAKEELEL